MQTPTDNTFVQTQADPAFVAACAAAAADAGVDMPAGVAPVGTAASVADEELFAPPLRNVGRILAAATGVAVGAAMLVVGGLAWLLNSCGGYGGGATCGPLVEPLTLVAVLAGAGAAVAGGAGTGATGQARWIGAGLAITIVLALLLAYLVGLQQPALT